ncbi:alpha/beta fold hydrolase [Pseudonocardia spinosispora]|uniref:alpha/beta fold hydrolase n=1 Tax=Pseudonocardia spinosispora TaxID=103441 RepID=UPI0003FD2406|nr:alpha/beta hydrolase [Pseudonocardia spinosispora]
MATLEQRFLDVDGARIQYFEGGTGEDLVFLHAVGGAIPGAPFLEQLAERYHVLAPSAPGFDASTGSAESIQDVADSFAAFITATVPGGAHVVGESFGAVSALWLAIRHPELVKNLVIAAPFAFLPPGPPPALDPKEMALRNFGPRPSVPEGFFTPSAGQQRGKNAGVGVPLLKGNDQTALKDGLKGITSPTLVLWSTEDQQVPPNLATIYVDAIPTVHVTYVPDSAHSLTVSAADRFVSLTSDFLAHGEMFVASVPGDQT